MRILLLTLFSAFLAFASPAHAAGKPAPTAAKKSPAKPLSWTPLRFSAWPHPDGAFPSIPRVRGLSLGLTVSHDDEAYGIQLAPVPSATRGGGLQIGAAPETGRFIGIQLGLLSASGKLFRGLQVSPLNNIDSAKTRVSGIQIGAVNGGGDVRGLQMGAVNRGGVLCGLQVGVVNASGRLRGGGQVGPLNLAASKKSGGFQLGAVNVSRERLSGIQIGLFNSTRSLKGAQLGVLNRVTSRKFLWGLTPLFNMGW
jgi:hypothetical protein